MHLVFHFEVERSW